MRVRQLTRFWRIVTASILVLLATICSFGTHNSLVGTARAATGINHQINFQGKVVNPDGTVSNISSLTVK